jgi:hypothetical protein
MFERFIEVDGSLVERDQICGVTRIYRAGDAGIASIYFDIMFRGVGREGAFRIGREARSENGAVVSDEAIKETTREVNMIREGLIERL